MSGSPLQCVMTMSPGLKSLTSPPTSSTSPDGGVARVDLPAPGLGDVDGVGQGGVVDVVLGRHGEDPYVHVAGAQVTQLELVERDHVGHIDLLDVATNPFPFPSDGVSGDRGMRGLSCP